MHSFAQTNIQLFNQLRDDRYPTAEILRVVACYEMGMRLFTGLFRASGKTFIAHLVGTASILGKLHANSNVVAAGLIHAAYSGGDFGDGIQGITSSRRDWIRSLVGSEIEEYVSRYAELHWTAETIPQIWTGMDSLGTVDREVLLMRLANELEELLDLGILYTGAERRRQSTDAGELTMRMAEKLGYPGLAAELEKALAEVLRADMVADIRPFNGRDVSFLIAPQSYQRVMDAITKRVVADQKEKTGGSS